MFANDSEDSYPDTWFGLDERCSDNQCSITSQTAAKQITKLVEKARRTIRELGLCLKVHDPSKMLNVLVMAQQLNIIDPVAAVIEVDPPKTAEEILKVPTVARKQTRFRNKKLSHGVMSDIEIVNTIKEMTETEKNAEKRLEIDKLNELELTKEIETLESTIKEDAAVIQEKREKLKALKVQKTTEKKESCKRKLVGEANKKTRRAKQLKPPTETVVNNSI